MLIIFNEFLCYNNYKMRLLIIYNIILCYTNKIKYEKKHIFYKFIFFDKIILTKNRILIY